MLLNGTAKNEIYEVFSGKKEVYGYSKCNLLTPRFDRNLDTLSMEGENQMNLVMIFIDGFGLGDQEANPIFAAQTPYFDELLGGHLLWGRRYLNHANTVLRSLDASLGIAGTPQSATGQTTLWTGVNAAQALGYHLNAFPNEQLWQIIRKRSIFKQLSDRGKKVIFANAFTSALDQPPFKGPKRYSASTLTALAAGLRLRRAEDLLEGKAVFQDMTNEIMRQRGADVPLMSAFEAGQNLGRLALEYDFTLYEFFQTDVKGHKQLWDEAVELIERIDSFIGGFLAIAGQEDVGFILTSDHGNIEDFRVKGHTLNPVPALCWSNRAVDWPEWDKLEDVTPGIITLLK